MIKWQLALLIVGLLWLLFFFVGIPLDVADEWTVSLALVGSLVWLALLLAFFFVFSSREEVSLFVIKLILVMVGFFGFAIAFIYQTTQHKQNELLHNGVLCRGKIIIPTASDFEHDQSYPISIRYAIDEKNTNTIEANLIWQTLNNQYFNWYVPVIYSKKYPLLSTALMHKNDYKKYAAYYDTLNASLKEDLPFVDTSDNNLLHNILVLISMGQDVGDVRNQLTKRYTDKQIDSLLRTIPVKLAPTSGSTSWPVLSSLATIFSLLGLIYKF
ncbi:MAG TPA: hypothetical protein PLU10_02805, partial [Chitinophagaceae bacterium]|nr:hypothetical protein [Chitinophagaceae bacterium]